MQQSDLTQLTKLSTQFSMLLSSASYYMQNLPKFLQSIPHLQKYHCIKLRKYTYWLIKKTYQIIKDPNQSTKKKMFAFRFIKDGILMADHSFIIFVLILILGLVMVVLQEGQSMKDNGLQMLVFNIAMKQQSIKVQQRTLVKSLLRLISQFIKWTGTHIKQQAYLGDSYSSWFALCLDRLSKVKAIKISQLTFFKPQDITLYTKNIKSNDPTPTSALQSNFIHLLYSNSLSLPTDDPDKSSSLKLLQSLITTNDSIFINLIVSQCIDGIKMIGEDGVRLMWQITKVKEVQFILMVRDRVLVEVATYLVNNAQSNYDYIEVLAIVHTWQLDAAKLGISTRTFKQFFQTMKSQWFFIQDEQYTSYQLKDHYKLTNINTQPYQKLLLSLMLQTNFQKSKFLNLNDNQQIIESIRNLKTEEKSIPSLKQNNLKIQSNKFIVQRLQNRLEPFSQSSISMVYGEGRMDQSIPGEFVIFNNTLGDVSQEGSKHQYQDNIYTVKNKSHHQQIIKKTNGSPSSKYSQSSSKRNHRKVQKATSIQRVKSSNYIRLKVQDYNDSNNIVVSRNESSISHSHIHNYSDNNPFKQDQTLRQDSSINIQRLPTDNNIERQVSLKFIKTKSEEIKVQQTVKKPKFGFSQANIQQLKLRIQKNPLLTQNQYRNIIQTDESITSQSNTYVNKLLVDDIPQNFNDIFKKQHKKQSNKLFSFPKQVKQLQKQLQKTKKYQLLYEQKLKQKDSQYQKLKIQVQNGIQKTIQQNYLLNKQLNIKKTQKLNRSQMKQQNLHLDGQKLLKLQDLDLKKYKIYKPFANIQVLNVKLINQALVQKPLLISNEVLNLGYNLKKSVDSFEYQLSLYFKFKINIKRLIFKLDTGSLIIRRNIDFVLEHVIKSKQIKVKANIDGYQLIYGQWKFPIAQIQTQLQNQFMNNIDLHIIESQNENKYKVELPCLLYNLIDFKACKSYNQDLNTQQKYLIGPFTQNQHINSTFSQYLHNLFPFGLVTSPKTFILSYLTSIMPIKYKSPQNPPLKQILFKDLINCQKRQNYLRIKFVGQGGFVVEGRGQMENAKLIIKDIVRIIINGKCNV